MDHPCLTFVLQNPDGTIQIASQPHLKGKKYMNCNYCKKAIIFNREDV